MVDQKPQKKLDSECPLLSRIIDYVDLVNGQADARVFRTDGVAQPGEVVVCAGGLDCEGGGRYL